MKNDTTTSAQVFVLVCSLTLDWILWLFYIWSLPELELDDEMELLLDKRDGVSDLEPGKS